MKLTNSDREDILGILEKHGIPTAEVLFHKKKGRIFIKTSAKDFHFSYFLKKSSFSDALGNKFSENLHYKVKVGETQVFLNTWKQVLECLNNYISNSF